VYEKGDGEKTYREHNWNTPPHGAAAVQLGRLAQPQLLVAGGILPAEHGRAVEEHLDALARGQLGRDA
jgi:hypothetical protein